MQLTEKQCAIVYAALLELGPGVIVDSLAGTEFDVTEDDVDELYHAAQEKCGADLPQ